MYFFFASNCSMAFHDTDPLILFLYDHNPLRTFSSPQEETSRLLGIAPQPLASFPLVLGNHNLLSVSVDLLILDISRKWNYIIHGLLWLTFIYRNVSCISTFYGQIIVHCMELLGYSTSCFINYCPKTNAQKKRLFENNIKVNIWS